jgi:NAD(P)-dependent dehydrogenase (short-subunit alcohol dehydrogenase family)
MIWLITGGTHGIGKALCELVAEHGHEVVTCSREDYDVSDPMMAEALVHKTAHEYGQIDVLVNNASIYERATVEHTSIDFWNKCIGTNLNGTFYMCKFVVPHMKQQQSGKIINVSSYVANFSPVERAAYNCSKLAVLGLTETLAKEVVDDNIKVNAFSPLKTATRMDVDETAVCSPEEAARQIYDLYEWQVGHRHCTGKFFVGREEAKRLVSFPIIKGKK